MRRKGEEKNYVSEEKSINSSQEPKITKRLQGWHWERRVDIVESFEKTLTQGKWEIIIQRVY